MTRQQSPRSRRRFLEGALAASAGLAAGLTPRPAPAAQAPGATERIRIGCIGVGNRGNRLIQRIVRFDDVEIAALCDVYRPYRERDRSAVHPRLLATLGGRVPPMAEPVGEGVDRYRDFRRVLDRKDIDATVIATPDHWHAIQAIATCESGKDVYIEKPLSITIHEGRRIVEAVKRTGRVAQVGLQRRSSQVYREIRSAVRGGALGKVTTARAYRISNMAPRGIGKAPDAAPPEGLDWDLWLGPRAWRPYRDTLAFYKFRWWQDYSSQVANWGVHYFDAIRWLLEEEAPVSISAHGGRFAIDDDRTIPDTLEVTFEFASGRLLVFGQYEASGGTALQSGEIELRGTRGNLYVHDRAWEIVPTGGGQFQDPGPRTEARTGEGDGQDTAEAHLRNFFDCVRSRRTPNCPVEVGHRSTTFALLANIALETRSRVEWDPREETITAPRSAASRLHYEYRQPWKLP